MLELEGKTITSQDYEVETLTRDGKEETGMVTDWMICHESWTCSDGQLVLLPNERIVDIGGYMLLIPDDLCMLGSKKNGRVTLLAYKAEGVISEWNEWSPFLIKEWK